MSASFKDEALQKIASRFIMLTWALFHHGYRLAKVIDVDQLRKLEQDFNSYHHLRSVKWTTMGEGDVIVWCEKSLKELEVII